MLKDVFISIVILVIGIFLIYNEGVIEIFDSNKYDQISKVHGEEKIKEEKIVNYHKYDTEDSIGRDMLDIRGEDREIQFEAWNRSSLKKDFFKLFPNFEDMRYFIDTHLRGKILTNYLLEEIGKIEDDFFAGKITTEDAKRRFRLLKY